MAVYTNKLFIMSNHLQNSSMVSKSKVNREYLISNYVADELNTYRTFTPFATFNDLYAPEYDDKGNEKNPDAKIGAMGVRSIFNKAGAVIIGDGIDKTESIIHARTSEWRISNNVPLMDNRLTRAAILQSNKCTVKDLVRASENGELGRATYAFSDFMYCKYLGKIPNNYLITLRRFPYPVDDYISSIGCGETRRNKEYSTMNVDSIGCLVTWLGTPGNDMGNILKYSVAMPFKEQKAEMQNSGINADSGGIFNSIAAAFDPTYRAQYQAGSVSGAFNSYAGKFFNVGDAPYNAQQWNEYKDNTKAYGPVDTIKTTYMRSEDGLTFDQNITITFDYELKSYNGINGRQAMLDLLSNILNVTYSTGTFWGGGFRGGGAHQNNIFANLKIFKARGGFTNFIDAFAEDYSTLSKKAGDAIDANGGILKTIGKIINTLGGMLLSGALNKLGRPHKALANSLLSPAPIGFWHLTIGNPHSPIMSIGNMILKNTTIEHYGPLGLDDFPTGIKVTCELTRGKSRDIRDIEKLYMHGNDRIYTSMGPKIFDMYKHSKEYKSKYKSSIPVLGDANAEITIGDSSTASQSKVTIDDIEGMKHVLQKYFGHADTNSIMIAAMEQEMGAHKKKKKGTAGGDSSAQGNK